MLVVAGPPDTAINREVYGAWGQWTVLHELLALAVDVLQIGNWQRGGGRGSRPRRLTRPRPPGERDPNTTRYGSDPLPLDAMDEWLGWAPQDRG